MRRVSGQVQRGGSFEDTDRLFDFDFLCIVRIGCPLGQLRCATMIAQRLNLKRGVSFY